MRRVLLSAVLAIVALLLQLTLIDQLPLPGGVSPDLVLLVVVALALSNGPTLGLITGFGAGLALDIAPPSNHLIGVYALVFCLAGYFCGLVAADLEDSVLLPLAASALGAAGGAALYAVAGVFLGNPDVTGQSVRHVLPLSVAYDVLLSPFVLYAVALASRLAARIAGAAVTGPGATSASPLALPGTAPGLQGGRTPRIRVAANRQRDGWIGGGGWLAASAELARSRPATIKLHLGGKTGARPASSPAASQQSKSLAKLRFGSGHRSDGIVGSRLLGSLFGGAGSPAGGLPGTQPVPKLFGRRGRPGAASPVRFGQRQGLFSKPAWGFRGAGGSGHVGAAAPRRGTFSASSQRKTALGWLSGRKSTASAAAPRHGTFTAPPQRKRHAPAGSPRRGTFSGGSSAKGVFGSGGPRRGAFGGGPRRLRALRRATARAGRMPGTRRTAIGRVRGGRWNRFKRNGGWR
jgi:rod shape-determining protein MreD